MERIALRELSRENQKATSRILWFACALVAGLVIAYLGNGFYNLCVDDAGAGDLRRRWTEQRYFMAGVDPNEATALSKLYARGEVPQKLAVYSKLSEEVGPLGATAYPPWSYAIGAIFVPTLPWWATRAYFSLLNVAALALCAAWAYRRGKPFGSSSGVLLALGVLAIFANAITLRHGQYPIVVNALLLGVLLCEERSHVWLSGILLGLAALKPNVALPYFLVLLVRGNLRGLSATVALVAGAAFAGAAHVGSNPIRMTLDRLKQPHDWLGHLGILEPLTFAGVSAESVSLVGLGLGLTLTFGIALKFRRLPALDLMAIAATLGQLCTYHRRYDQVNLMFPLVALCLLALRNPGRETWAAFLIFAASLWLPHRDAHLTFYPLAMAQYLAWILGIVVLLKNRLPEPVPAPETEFEGAA